MDINFNLRIFSFNWKISISRQWVRFGIIVVVLLLNVAVSYWGSSRMLLLFGVMLGGMGVLLVLMQHLNVGFILLFLCAIFVPYTGPSNVNAAVAMVVLMLGLWVMDMLVVKRRFEFINSRVLLPVTILFFVSIISFGMGQVPWFRFASQAPLTAQVGGFAIFALSISTLVLAAHLIKDLQWLKVIVWTFIGFGAIYVTARVLKISVVDRYYNVGFTAGSMFWTWLIVLTLSQVIFNTQLKVRIRVLLMGIVLATLYVALFQAYDWKSGWVPPLVGIAALLGIRFKKYIIFAIPLVLIIILYATGKLVASDEYSWGTRVDAWIIVLEISRVNPLLGLGFSNYYWYTPLYPIRGWRVSFNSHSQYVDLIAQVGIIGLLCFLWIFYEVGYLSWRLGNQLKDGFARSYAYGVLAGVAASLMAAFLVDWILPFVYNIGFRGFRASILPWIFFGGLVSLEQMYLKKVTA